MTLSEDAAVIGPGAVGSYLAWRLSRSGPVRLVGRSPGWLRRLRAGGLRISTPEDPSGRVVPAARLQPRLGGDGPSAAVVFLCVKAPDLAGALRTARPLVGPDTAVVSLLNGLTHVEQAVAAFGRRRTVIGVTYLAAMRLDPAHVRHNGGDAIVLSRNVANRGAAERSLRLLRAGGISAGLSGPEDRLLWTKAVFNAAINPLGALTARPNGDLARTPALREILLRAVAEGAAAARAAGRGPLEAERLARRAVVVCLAAPSQENSMLQDLRAGRPTEASAILLPLLRAARRRGVPTPVLASYHRFLARLERELRA